MRIESIIKEISNKRYKNDEIKNPKKVDVNQEKVDNSVSVEELKVDKFDKNFEARTIQVAKFKEDVANGVVNDEVESDKLLTNIRKELKEDTNNLEAMNDIKNFPEKTLQNLDI